MLHRLQHNRTDKICMAVYVTFFWALAIQYVLNPHPIPYMIADICPFSVLIDNFDCSHFVSCVTIHPRLRASPYIFWGCCCCCKQLGSLVSPRAWKSSLDTDQCLAHFCRIIMGQIQVSSCGGWHILYCLWWRPPWLCSTVQVSQRRHWWGFNACCSCCYCVLCASSAHCSAEALMA